MQRVLLLVLVLLLALLAVVLPPALGAVTCLSSQHASV